MKHLYDHFIATRQDLKAKEILEIKKRNGSFRYNFGKSTKVEKVEKSEKSKKSE